MTDESDLLERVEDGVRWITLNRPDAGNALTPDQRNRIIDLLDRSDSDRAVRAVVIGANGRHFCTGADLSVDHGTTTDDGGVIPGSIIKTLASGSQRLIATILECQKPVVAAVGGTAAGIGAHLAFACDLVVASDAASFIEVFVRRGLAPDGGGAYLLPRLVGLQRAKELVLLGEKLSAVDALQIGLVTTVVPAAELDGTVRELAARLAAGPTVAMGMAKRLLNTSLDGDRAAAFLAEAMSQEIVTGTADATEGVASFLERRPSQFQGR